MSKIKLKRPAPGTVLGFIALLVALAGNANAFSTQTTIVRKGDIAPGAVTAKALAKGAVHAKALAQNAVGSKALAKGAVNARALAGGAVGAVALAPDAVTAAALAPGSVYGGALGPVTLHSASIADADESPASGTWTASSSGTALCAPGEHLLTGGIVFTNPGNREVGVLESLPFSNATSSGIAGRITSNSGGSAAAEVQAICLK
jgi:hypothetical protein